MKDPRQPRNHAASLLTPDLEDEKAKNHGRSEAKFGGRAKWLRRSGHPGHPSLQTQLLEESEAMARYALTSGLVVPADTVEKLEYVAAQVRRQGSGADSYDLRTNGSPAGDGTYSNAGGNRFVRLLATIHDQLARIVAPATPRTIHLFATESATGGFWHFLGPVPLVRQMMLAAIICLLAIVGLSLSDQVNTANVGKEWLELSGRTLLYNLLFLIAAAGLGASFQALFQANRYVVAGTFDPKYESSYWIRFVLGLIAGLLLAELIPLPTEGAIGGLGKPALAILGGFSSAVVYRVINQLITAVESLVRGDTKDIIASREQALKAYANEEIGRNRLKLAGNLMSLQQQLGAGASPEQLSHKLGQLLGELMPPGVTVQTGRTPAPKARAGEEIGPRSV
ncbi:hypothetical protein [Candidatus Thiosymbion oneisti]|uniref:hypothetical protein n=1 Tax=Candidatus Thiosymbion oneisti TaxID=589554 RepID=UPI000B081190|nr:hypothetical protein [Candidatus Thiosymbion oneisti]